MFKVISIKQNLSETAIDTVKTLSKSTLNYLRWIQPEVPLLQVGTQCFPYTTFAALETIRLVPWLRKQYAGSDSITDFFKNTLQEITLPGAATDLAMLPHLISPAFYKSNPGLQLVIFLGFLPLIHGLSPTRYTGDDLCKFGVLNNRYSDESKYSCSKNGLYMSLTNAHYQAAATIGKLFGRTNSTPVEGLSACITARMSSSGNFPNDTDAGLVFGFSLSDHPDTFIVIRPNTIIFSSLEGSRIINKTLNPDLYYRICTFMENSTHATQSICSSDGTPIFSATSRHYIPSDNDGTIEVALINIGIEGQRDATVETVIKEVDYNIKVPDCPPHYSISVGIGIIGGAFLLGALIGLGLFWLLNQCLPTPTRAEEEGYDRIESDHSDVAIELEPTEPKT